MIKNINLLEKINTYKINPSLCLFCKIELEYSKKNNKYCTKSCAAKLNNKKFPKRKLEDQNKCIKCSKKRSLKSKSGLCKNCFHGHEEKIERWLSGENFISKSVIPVTPGWIKKHIIKTRGAKCEICGFDKLHPVTNRPIIELDHIDGNSRNNLENNLRLLCLNCHGATNNYRSLNIGKGRIGRNKNNA